MKKFYLALILLITSINVAASIITYTDRTTFQNSTGALISFEGFNGSLNTGITVDPAGGHQSYWNSIKTEGSHSLGLVELSAVTFTFDSPVYAFGFDISNTDELVRDYSDSDGNFISNFVPLYSGDLFFGVSSDVLITSFTLGTGADTSGQVYFIDALETRSSSSVPEPTSLALLGLGLAGFGFSRKKKKV